MFVLLVVLDQLIAYAVREECREKDEVWEGAGGNKGSKKKNNENPTFKDVLIAVYMTEGLKTKCKTCFGGPRMILHAL